MHIRGYEMFIVQKVWRALFFWNTHFKIRHFGLLPTKYILWMSLWSKSLKVPVNELTINFSKFADLQTTTSLTFGLIHIYFFVAFSKDMEQPFYRTPPSGCFCFRMFSVAASVFIYSFCKLWSSFKTKAIIDLKHYLILKSLEAFF